MVQYYEDGDVAIFDNLVFRRDKKTGYYLNAQKIAGNISTGKFRRVVKSITRILKNQTMKLAIFKC